MRQLTYALLGLVIAFVVHPVVHWQTPALQIRIVQRDQVQPLDHSMVLARPKVINQLTFFRITVRFVQNTIIYTDNATFQN